MAITVNWGSRVIFVPKSDLVLLQSSPTEIRELNVDVFRLTLKDLEDDEAGMSFPATHNHVAPISVGGVTLARVVELINNYTVTFEDGSYAVNIAGGNSNIGDRVNVNQVSVRSANSAGLVQSREIEYSSFGEGVTIDVVNGAPGTLYPTGTSTRPVNNLQDAILIADLRGFKTFFVKGALALGAGDVVDDYLFHGDSSTVSSIVLDPAAVVTNCRFKELRVSGTLDGGSTIDNCIITNLIYVDGQVSNTVLGPGTISLATGAEPVVMLDCWANGDATIPTLDLGGAGPDVAVRNYNGDINLTNKSGGGVVVVGLNVGRVIIDSSVTGGTVIVRGVGSLIDNSAGATVDATDLISGAQIAGVPEALLDLPNGIENNLTLREALRLFTSVLIGKVSGAGTGTEVFRDYNDTKPRVTSTVDQNGNRTNVSTDST